MCIILFFILTKNIFSLNSFSFSLEHNLFKSQHFSSDVFVLSKDIFVFLQDKYDLERKSFFHPLAIYCTYLTVILNHEFGHSSICRRFGWRFKYAFNWSFTTIVDISSYIKENKILFQIAGFDSNHIFFNKIREQIFLKQKIQCYDSMIYIFSSIQQFFYIYLNIRSKNNGNDILIYTDEINEIYKNNFTFGLKGFIDLVDPILIYSFLSMITKKKFEIPKKLKFCPSLRLMLTPFSVQYLLIGYFLFSSFNVLRINVGIEQFHFDKKSLCFEIESKKFFKIQKTHFGFRSYYAKKPEIFQKNDLKDVFLFMIYLTRNINEYFEFGLQMGMKNKGYIYGELLENNFIVRIFLTVSK